MKIIILLISLSFLPIFGWASSCPINQYFTLIHTDNMYPNSSIWVNKPYEVLPLIAISNHEKISLKVDTIKSTNEIYKYKADQLFTPNKEYQIETKSNAFSQFNPNDYTFEVKALTNLPSLKWINKPQFIGYEITPANPQFSQSGQLNFSFKTNLNPKDYLILVHAVNITKFGDPQSFILNPSIDIDLQDPLLSMIYFGYHQCENQLSFDENDEIWVKFDLVTHDGIIIAWQDAPVKFTIKEPSKPQNETTSNLHWYERLCNWITQLISALLS